MGVADHVLESISGQLSRCVLEHYSHIRIDAKRQALDALDDVRRDGDGANGYGKPANDAHSRFPDEADPETAAHSRGTT